VYAFVAEFGIARIAIRQVVVIIVVCVIVVDKAPAILTGSVVVFIATVAKVDVFISLGIIPPYALGTVVANSRMFV
jgi:hypothetical protein